MTTKKKQDESAEMESPQEARKRKLVEEALPAETEEKTASESGTPTKLTPASELQPHQIRPDGTPGAEPPIVSEEPVEKK